MVNIKKIIMYILLTLFMLSGIIYRLPDYAFLSNILTLVPGIMIVFIVLLLRKGNVYFFFTTIDKLYLLFLVACIVSSVINGEIINFFTTFTFTLFYLVLVICQRNSPEIISFKLLLLSYATTAISVIVLEFLNNPHYFIASTYNGLFGNPNSLGIFAATIFIVSISFVILRLHDSNVKTAFSGLLVSFFSFLLVTISGSRTSFVGIILVLIIVLVSYIISLIKKNGITKKQLFKMLLFIFIISMIIYYIFNSSIYVIIESNIIEKFQRRSGNITSNRNRIWKIVIENSTFFGHESGYIETLLNGLSAHNTFLYQTGQFGWFAGIFYILFWVTSFVKSLIYFVNNFDKDKYSIFSLTLISLFIIISMLEAIPRMTLMYLALFSVGYLTHKEFILNKSKRVQKVLRT